MLKPASLAVIGSFLLAGAAVAQTNPSAAQIINSLTPSGNVSDTTRGIRPLSPSGNTMAPMPGMGTPAAMSSAMSSPMASSVAKAAPTANLDIEFHSGSAVLTPSAVAELNQLGEALTSKTLAAYNFKIVGHTDTTGVPAANQKLSELRAAAVKKYLEDKFRVPETKLAAAGVGEADLLVPTPPQTPELRNRRVEIVNLGEK
jgi:outer membrane protein OmpA-like peptidoglycan-associated protein